MTTEKKKSTGGVAHPYEPTPRERKTLEKYLAHRNAKGVPGIKVDVQAGVTRLSANHEDNLVGQMLLMEAIGSKDLSFYDVLITQLADVGRQGKTAEERGLNFMLAVIKGLEPRDQVEAMLAAQMAAVHNATMTFARRLNHVENIPQQDSAERAFNKLARTFATQVEALKRYRSTGQQQILVQRVNVSDGGQAIVGTINQAPGEGASEKIGEQPHALGHEKGAEMLGQVKAKQASVPITSCSGS